MSPILVRRSTEREAAVLDNVKPRGINEADPNSEAARIAREVKRGLDNGNDMTVLLTGDDASLTRSYLRMGSVRALLARSGILVSATQESGDGEERILFRRKK